MPNSETSTIGKKLPTTPDQPAALTTQLTAITHTAPSTPDYAIQQMTASSPVGFVTVDEADTLLSVVANLQTRVAEMEVILEGLNAVASN